MPLTRLEHFLVLTDNIDATRDFYVNVLGLRVGARPPLEFAGYWVYVEDVPSIHIAEWDSYRAHSERMGIPVSARGPGAVGPVDHLAFNGLDKDSIRAQLHANHVSFGENTVPHIQLTQFFLSDPNGVKIEINVMPAVGQ